MKNFGIIRLQKFSAGAVTGIQRHDRREAEKSRSNPNINYSKSKYNYDLKKENEKMSFSKKLKSIISNLQLKRKIRKDAVVMCQLLVTASPDFFSNKTEEETRKFFEESYRFLCKKYGSENVVSAIVHMDEKTPHLHFNFVPITKTKKLSAKELFNPQSLKKLQDEVFSQVFSKYGLARGERKEEKVEHISTLNLKVLTLQKQIEEKKEELKKLQKQVDNSELYKLRKNLQSMQEKLSQMLEVVNSDPQLLKEYRSTINKLKKSKNPNMEQIDI